MTLTEMMNEINALGRSIRAAADRLMADAADNTHDMQDIERQQNALRDMNNRMAALRLAYTTQEDAERGNLTAPQGSGASAGPMIPCGWHAPPCTTGRSPASAAQGAAARCSFPAAPSSAASARTIPSAPKGWARRSAWSICLLYTSPSPRD